MAPSTPEQLDPKQALAQLRLARNTIDIATALGVSHFHLVKYLYRIAPERRYRTFSIPKRSGGTRQINAPVKQIRNMQKRFGVILDEAYQPTINAHGFIKTRSTKSNARPHVRARWILNVDLADFFGTVNFGRVQGVLQAAPFNFSPKVAACLAHLCTHQGTLPQGAPTSPRLANLVCRSLDRQLRKLAFSYGCRYTRYADDITVSTRKWSFSSDLGIRGDPDGKTIAGPKLRQIVEANGFSLNEQKTRLMSNQNRKEVTGLIVNKKVNVPRDYIRGLRALLHNWEIHGPERALIRLQEHNSRLGRPSPASVARVAQGMLGYIKMIRGVDDELYKKLVDAYNRASGAPIDIDAVWVLESSTTQGTGFMLKGVGLVTSEHVVVREDETTGEYFLANDLAMMRADGSQKIKVKCKHRSKDLDLAICDIDAGDDILHELEQSQRTPQVGDYVQLLGFPKHAPGRSYRREEGRIVAIVNRHGASCLAINCVIAQGASGGPLLDADGRVIGIARFGQYEIQENIVVSVIDIARLHNFDANGVEETAPQLAPNDGKATIEAVIEPVSTLEIASPSE